MTVAADASAILAIIFNEPDGGKYLSRLIEAPEVWISAVNWWEVQARVHSAQGAQAATKSAAWMQRIGIKIEPVTAEHAQTALAAFARYGGRPARLNMGDCFAYALARVKGVPLLYKGGDFAHTDVETS